MALEEDGQFHSEIEKEDKDQVYETESTVETTLPNPHETAIVVQDRYGDDVRPLGTGTTSESTKDESDQTFDVTPRNLQSLLLQKAAQMIFFPLLIILGGLPESGKSTFLRNILPKEKMSTEPAAQSGYFSENVVVASDLWSPLVQPCCAEVMHDHSLKYSFLSGARYYFKMKSLVATFDSISASSRWNSQAFIKNQTLNQTAIDLCNFMHKKSIKPEGSYSKRLVGMEHALHKGVNVSYLWDITVNRTVLRFLECFRGHLYNSCVWLFVDLDRDIDNLHDPPKSKDGSLAMKWRSCLHYLLKSSCLSESHCSQPKRVKICRLIGIHNNLDETSLQNRKRKLKEEAENAATQYGLVHLFNFEIVTVNTGDIASEKEAYKFFLRELQNLAPQHIPLSWTFFRKALNAHSSIFLKYEYVCELAKDLKLDLDVNEFLKFYTSFGSILDVRLVDKSSKYIIHDPAKFLEKLCCNLLLKPTKFGIITQEEALEKLGEVYKEFFDVLVSVGLVAIVKRSRLFGEHQSQVENDSFVYYMSVIRQGEPDGRSLPEAVQLVTGLKSPAMNMQIAFTNQILGLLPNAYLVQCEQLNVTRFKLVTNRSNIDIMFVVQADTVEIRLTPNQCIEDLDNACTGIVQAIKIIAELREKRGGKVEYQLRYICTKKTNESQTDYQKYHILTEPLHCEHCTKLFVSLNVHQHFKIAIEKENIAKDRFNSMATTVTADDALMLAKEIQNIEDAKTLSLSLSEEPPRPSSEDPLWYGTFNIIMNWKRRTEDPSKQALVQKLLKNDTELFKRMARNLDIRTYSAIVHQRHRTATLA